MVQRSLLVGAAALLLVLPVLVWWVLRPPPSLGGDWIGGADNEPPPGPYQDTSCPPGDGYRLTVQGDEVKMSTFLGPSGRPRGSTPYERASGRLKGNTLVLEGVRGMHCPVDEVGQTLACDEAIEPVRYTLVYDHRTGHLVGTKNNERFWMALRQFRMGKRCWQPG